ncbi:MAG: hypothetical protein IAF38_05085 [Bacteroidia bacterium]|nr:hypothetical protein [Bacteroidia bacterium]
MKTVFLSILFLSFCYSTNAGTIEDAMKKIPRANAGSIDGVIEYIKDNASSDRDKAKAVYCWITYNVKYDVKKFLKDKPSNSKPEDVFKKKLAVCEGISNLYKEMCVKLGLKCEIVDGFSKGFGYKTGAGFTEADHAWNVVMFDGSWHIVDATWGAGEIRKGIFRQKFKRNPSDDYFDQSPKDVILMRAPEIAMWQLLSDPVSLKTFMAGDKKIAEHFKNPGKTVYSFKDTINYYLGLAEKIKIPEYGRMALKYNSRNSIPLAFGIFRQTAEFLMQQNGKLEEKQFDSLSLSVKNAIDLLKNKRSVRSAVQEAIDKGLIDAHEMQSGIYLLKSEYPRKRMMNTNINSYDSLSLYSNQYIKCLSLVVAETKESENKKMYKELNNDLCEMYVALYDSYSKFFKLETNPRKQREIKKEMDAQLKIANRIAMEGSNCAKLIQQRK